MEQLAVTPCGQLLKLFTVFMKGTCDMSVALATAAMVMAKVLARRGSVHVYK